MGTWDCFQELFPTKPNFIAADLVKKWKIKRASSAMPGIICHELFTIFTFCFLQSPSPLLPSQRRSSHVPLPSRSVCTGVWLSEDVWGGGVFRSVWHHAEASGCLERNCALRRYTLVSVEFLASCNLFCPSFHQQPEYCKSVNRL